MDERTVRLNVGGQSFEVARSTLCAHPGYLANLLDCDGSIFIDRDPAHFPSVLAWLRDGQGMALPESDAARRVHIAFFSIRKFKFGQKFAKFGGLDSAVSSRFCK